MKLRSPFRLQQLLSLLGCALLLASTAWAQTDAILILRDGSQRPGQKVIRMTPTGTGIEIATPDGKGAFVLPLAQVREVLMAEPPKLAEARAAYQKKDFAAAFTALKEVTDRYKGLPSPWARQAVSLLANVLLAKRDIPGAEAAVKEYQRVYPGQASLQVEVSTGLIAAAKKDLETAKAKLEPVAQQALKEKNVANENAFAYSQTFLALGEIREAEGKLADALEDYLRTVTLYYHDRAAAAQAQEKADALRKAHKEITVP